jgi:molybdopterin molybdotransferase
LSELLDVNEAKQRLLEFFSPVGSQSIALDEAINRILAEDVNSNYDLPLFSNSSMDGFAVREEDVRSATPERPAILRVAFDIPAGSNVNRSINSGEAARIMTGASLPEGANAVVPVEYTNFEYREPGRPLPEEVEIYRSVAEEAYVRPQGQDVRKGEVVGFMGQRMRPQEIGFMAMLGIVQVQVHRLPRVALFSSGDELVPIEQDLTPGKIHDSNTHTLISLVNKYGGKAINLGIAPDEKRAVRERLEQAVEKDVDLIISSAGVSVGAFDYVRTVVEEAGRLEFWRVNMRPGKPLAFGEFQRIPFIGLPGNPVSAFVGFEVYIRPALQKMAGSTQWERPFIDVSLDENIESDGRESYLRAVIRSEEGIHKARLTGHQGSGNLRSLVQANALLLVPSGVKFLPAGARVSAWMLD